MVSRESRKEHAIEPSLPSTPGPDPLWTERFIAHASVTDRERDVLSVLLGGATVPEGARRLGLATSTVRMHVKNLHSKSATNNLHSLAVWAMVHHECCWRD